MSAVIELQDIYKTYQMEKVEVHAVAGASFSINEGDFAAISGPSGSGKSTLLNLIGLIDLPTSGKIILNGIDVYKDMRFEKSNHIPNKLDKMLTELRRNNLGFIFQTFNLIPVLNVFENIEFPLKTGKSPATESLNPVQRKEWIEFLLETVGLTAWKNHKPSELSGGQRQRVAIARALVNGPAVLFADEPSGNLDSVTKQEIHRLFFEMRERHGQTIVIVTHDNALADECDRKFTMQDGMILKVE